MELIINSYSNVNGKTKKQNIILSGDKAVIKTNINGHDLLEQKIDVKTLEKYLENPSISYDDDMIGNLFNIYSHPKKSLRIKDKVKDLKFTEKHIIQILKTKNKKELEKICKKIKVSFTRKNRQEIIEILGKTLKKYI